MTVPFRKPSSVWAGFLAPNPAKRWTELFFLAYSPVWITWVLCILVPFRLYEVGGVKGAGTVGAACFLSSGCARLPRELVHPPTASSPRA